LTLAAVARVNRSVSCCCLVCYVGAVQDQILSDDHVEPGS
jgi:hypothetical protein